MNTNQGVHQLNQPMRIQLTKGKWTIVDAEDYAELIKFKWHYREGYAKRAINRKGDRRAIAMHNQIMNTPKGFEVDHINGDGLDNRKCNLRVCKHQQNTWNRKSVTGSSSKYKGVSWQAATGYWKVNIKIDEKQMHIGCFWDEEDAARAYNRVAKGLHKEFAKLNPVEDGESPSRILRSNKRKRKKK